MEFEGCRHVQHTLVWAIRVCHRRYSPDKGRAAGQVSEGLEKVFSLVVADEED